VSQGIDAGVNRYQPARPDSVLHHLRAKAEVKELLPRGVSTLPVGVRGDALSTELLTEPASDRCDHVVT
jgi:hypothetical protein